MTTSSTSAEGRPVVRTLAFGDLTIDYDDLVLAPRPWTLAQSTWAADILLDLPDGPVLELCSGAGHIGLAAARLSGRPLVMVDDDPHACELARGNAERAGVECEIRRGRFTEVLDDTDRFVLVIADPPWVPTSRVGDHPRDPQHAIDGGLDGLEVVRSCLTVVARHLRPDGRAVLQLGTSHQVDVLRRSLRSAGLAVLEVRTEDGGVLVLLGLRSQA